MTNYEAPSSTPPSEAEQLPAQQCDWLVNPEYPYTVHDDSIALDYSETGCPCEAENRRLNYGAGE